MKTQFKPDFEQLLKVLNRERPDRPALFEFFLNGKLHGRHGDFFALGYDYQTTIGIHDLVLPFVSGPLLETLSQNESLFANRSDFEAFPWRDPDPAVYREKISAIAKDLPAGGKYVGSNPQSVLGGLVAAFGYENLCMLIYDDPEFVRDVAGAIGKRLIMHVDLLCSFDCYGATILNDDWGFATQTRLAPSQMREFIIPWYTKMAEAAHSHGKPVILHSCGNMWGLIDDICGTCKIDAKHSFEDNILPVEAAYETYGSRIAIVGGIDVDYLCRKSPEEIKARANALLDQTESRGGYALGSGNSIPEYVPDENYLAMTSAALERRQATGFG
ncbi:MAG: uroporphyrinogen decarboxylase family protein [Kiritimatiellae bacterium]|nr:uroporphyrinogen decarboxylase family protein [Kiritimatiellia bacterium]